MSAQVNAAITRGERRSQAIRPATVTYARATLPCTPGNHDFFQIMRATGGGLTDIHGQWVRILRADLPPGLNDPASAFRSGQNVQVKDLESGDVFDLIIGQNNSWQAAVLILMLESRKA